MPYICDSCSRKIAGEGFGFELEPLTAEDDNGTAGARARLCRRCMRSLTSAPAVRRVLEAQSIPNPSLAESGPGRAADGLCEVTLAIEAVDYNEVRVPHLVALMDAWETIHKMTLQYRQDQQPRGRG